MSFKNTMQSIAQHGGLSCKGGSTLSFKVRPLFATRKKKQNKRNRRNRINATKSLLIWLSSFPAKRMWDWFCWAKTMQRWNIHRFWTSEVERVHFKSPFNVNYLLNYLVRPSFKVLALCQCSFLEERWKGLGLEVRDCLILPQLYFLTTTTIIIIIII